MIETGSRETPETSRPRATPDMLDAAQRKAAQAEADLDQKRRPYEADPLFMYLWNRGYGTPGYRAVPVVRYLDRKVARLVGFDGARRNYAVLLDLPARLRQHAEQLRAEVGVAEPTHPQRRGA